MLVMARKKSKTAGNLIVENRKARFDYHIEEHLEAGLSLTGWEVKSLREGKIQLVDSYVLVKNGEAWLIGCQITPLQTASAHVVADPRRDRKLLLHRNELNRLTGRIEAKGYTCVCTRLYWKGHLVKADIGVAKGKQTHDKRATTKDREWQREKGRIMKNKNLS
jgi:SsrA-binding protein